MYWGNTKVSCKAHMKMSQSCVSNNKNLGGNSKVPQKSTKPKHKTDLKGMFSICKIIKTLMGINKKLIQIKIWRIEWNSMKEAIQ